MVTINDERPMDLRVFLSSMDLDCERLSVYWDSGSRLSFKQEVEPVEFLKFSEDDLLRGDKQGLVNALTNAKRAIDSQVDRVFGCLGVSKKRNFPQKIRILQDMGLIAPRIITKVSNLRNLLEHEYKLPSKEQVEDAVDIANLFVFALESSLYNFPDSFFIRTCVEGKKKNGVDEFVIDKEIHIRFDENKCRFTMEGYFLDTETFAEEYGLEYQKITKKIGSVTLLSTEQGYLQLVGIASKAFTSYNMKEDVSKFIRTFV